MSGRWSTDEAPVCVGSPADWTPEAPIGSLCSRAGTVSLLQLRPGPDSLGPSLWWLTACPKHQRAVRDWMRAGWTDDEVDTYGTAFLVEHQDQVQNVGAPVWRVAVPA